MEIEFKRIIPYVKTMFKEGKNIEEISDSLGIESDEFYKKVKKYSSEFSDLNFKK